MKLSAKSGTVGLIVGLVLLTLILPGAVSAYSTTSLNAQSIAATVPSSVNTGMAATVTGSVPPKALFTSNVTQGKSPLHVQFTDQSTGTAPMTYHWDFSDGGGNLPENSQKNPVWRFWEDAGTSYTVTLTVTNAYGSDTIVKQNYITLGSTPSVAPVAAFTSSVKSGTAPLTVQFTDQSTGTPLTYAWDFNNDKKSESTVKSPSYTYPTAGNYTVNLTVMNANGKDSEIKTGYIRVVSPVTSAPPTAQFDASVTKGVAPLTVQFTDKSVSTGTTSYSLDINNDGVAEYTTKSPVHTYKAAGNYTVKLTVKNATGSDTEIKTNYIAVVPSTTSTLPTAQFTANTTKGVPPLTVQFTDKSVSAGTTTYKWDINNDGVVDYTTRNPVHKYTTAGTYAVKLTVGNASGSDTETKTSYITVSSTSIISGETFGAEPNPTGNPIGGGPGYTKIIAETDPSVKYVVATKDQLINALKNAKSGEVIFVKGSAKIDLTNTYQLKIPAGVTLASDRGKDGSLGGLLYRHRGTENTWAQIFTFVAGGDNVRVTGLRLNGENAPQDDTSANENLYLVGILFQERQGAVVDNCELWGWSQSGIIVDRGTSYIHHNSIHHNQARGEGYGVTVNGGFALIEANLFDYNRHSIDGEGVPGESYEARYNIHLGHGDAIGGHHFDVHGYPSEATSQIGGNKYLIHHNTFLNSELMAVGVRAQPTTGFYIDHNIFQMKYNEYPVIYKIKTGTWDKMFMSRNMIARNGGTPVLVEGADYWKYHY